MTTNEIIDKNEKFFDIDILLSSYSHYSKTNNILSLNILKTILYLKETISSGNFKCIES